MPGALAGGLLEDPLHPVVGRLWHPRYGHPGRLPWRLHAIDRSPAIARLVSPMGGDQGWIATDASDPIRHHVQSASCRLVHQKRPHGTILQARQGLRRGPWEAPGVPLGAGDRDSEPSSLRRMAPYRLSKLDWIGLLGFCGSSGVILYPELPLEVRSPLRPSYSPSQCHCVPFSHASRVPATAFVSVGYAGRLPAWCSQAPLAA